MPRALQTLREQFERKRRAEGDTEVAENDITIKHVKSQSSQSKGSSPSIIPTRTSDLRGNDVPLSDLCPNTSSQTFSNPIADSATKAITNSTSTSYESATNEPGSFTLRPSPSEFCTHRSSSPIPQQETALDPDLSPEQVAILSRVLKGENIFFTGSAGTGKSVLLRAIVKAFHDVIPTDRLMLKRTRKLAVTAPTGVAAANINGLTLHSWSCIELGRGSAEELVDLILRDPVATGTWRTTDALIIDEISMVDGNLFDKLEIIGRVVRQDCRPFGGLQLILCGDFFQLAPIGDKAGQRREGTYCFDSDSWDKVIPRCNMLALHQDFRQKEDRFVAILENMRKGEVDEDHLSDIVAMNQPLNVRDGVEPTELFATRFEVDRLNQRRLDELETSLHVFCAKDRPGENSRGYQLSSSEATGLLDRQTTWPSKLDVKVGALVMLLIKLKVGLKHSSSARLILMICSKADNLVNGSTGIIVSFATVAEAASAKVHIPSLSAYWSPPPDVLFPVIDFLPTRHSTSNTLRRKLVPRMGVRVETAMRKLEAEQIQVPLILAWFVAV